MNELYGIVFTYNPHKCLWFAFKHEHLNDYMNGTIKKEDYSDATDLAKLIEIVIKK